MELSWSCGGGNVSQGGVAGNVHELHGAGEVSVVEEGLAIFSEAYHLCEML